MIVKTSPFLTLTAILTLLTRYVKGRNVISEIPVVYG